MENKENLNPRPFWIIQTAFLGDIILSLPFLSELERVTRENQNPIIFITTAVGKEIVDLSLSRSLATARHRIHVRVWNKKTFEGSPLGMAKLARQLKEQWGIPSKVFCLQRSFRSGFLAWLSDANSRVGFSSGSSGNYFYTHNVVRSWDEGRHEIEKNLDLLRASFPEAKIPSWVHQDSSSLLTNQKRLSQDLPYKKNDELVVAMSLGSPWGTKRWPTENATSLIKKMTQEGIAIKFLGDSSTRDMGDQVKSQVSSLLFENLTGKTSVSEWIEQISKCDFLIGGDSAAVHAASDLGVPVLALFGPTLPEFGFAPWRKGSRVLGVKDLSCRPCHIHGPKVCPKKHHKCMKDLSPDEVYSYFQVMRLKSSRTGQSSRTK